MFCQAAPELARHGARPLATWHWPRSRPPSLKRCHGDRATCGDIPPRHVRQGSRVSCACIALPRSGPVVAHLSSASSGALDHWQHAGLAVCLRIWFCNPTARYCVCVCGCAPHASLRCRISRHRHFGGLAACRAELRSGLAFVCLVFQRAPLDFAFCARPPEACIQCTHVLRLWGW